MPKNRRKHGKREKAIKGEQVNTQIEISMREKKLNSRVDT